ncbi:hypothetical protein F2Q69_00062097 [Brassica cretica]|uniref:Uncharacterized protein n=1 Tax=Brassica cretica TaxID=69181 RepID=A0A8S9RNX1_BRACR|nr:hypothetical protein F2Q69_00062097 [Brassica cretica]
MSLALRQSVLFRRILVLFEAARWRRFEGGNGFRSRCPGAVEICVKAFQSGWCFESSAQTNLFFKVCSLGSGRRWEGLRSICSIAAGF